jgi:hypothetical protein
MIGSAQIDEPPSPSKLELIRRFLIASGIQERIDSGSFLDGFGVQLMSAAAKEGTTFKEAADAAFGAVRNAYAKHGNVWQEEYERHVNWEFTEGELRQIVEFLEDPVGQHFLEGRWRMDAYIGTNTEELTQQIFEEAEESLKQG